MPKKGKKGKKGKKAKVDDLLPEDAVQKEKLLTDELASLTDEVEVMKKKVEELRQENDFLQQEANSVRRENEEYMSYMEKKTAKRQHAIITLNDHNQKEIRDLQEQKRIMLEEYEQKKAELRNLLLEKENKLTRIQKELASLQDVQEIQNTQTSEIKELERQLLNLRSNHSESIQLLKSKFLEEKRNCQAESLSKVSAMSKQANKEAVECLNEHTDKIRDENKALRQELLNLIRKTRALHKHKHYLEEQRRNLLLEQQYAEDIKLLRTTRQHKVYRSFGLLRGVDELDPVEDAEDHNSKASQHDVSDHQPAHVSSFPKLDTKAPSNFDRLVAAAQKLT